MSDNGNRKTGYYWVKHENWIVAKWNKLYPTFFWTISGIDYSFKDSDFSEINEIPIAHSPQTNDNIELLGKAMELIKNMRTHGNGTRLKDWNDGTDLLNQYEKTK